MKKLMAIGLTTVMAIGLVGCGGSQSSTIEKTEPSTPAEAFNSEKSDTKETHSAEMEGTITYELSRGITDFGEQSLMLSYTNNTNHPIVSAQFLFDIKEDLTEEEKDLQSQLQNKFEIDDGQMDWAYFQSNTDCYTDCGEASKPSAFTFFLNCITDETYCNLADYGKAQIIYVDGEKYYQSTFDFYSQTFTPASPYKNAFEWFTSEIGATIPQPDGLPTLVSTDEETKGFAYVYNVSLDTFETYVDTCKNAGFSKVDFDGGDNITIGNDSGTNLSLYYSSSDNSMVVKFD